MNNFIIVCPKCGGSLSVNEESDFVNVDIVICENLITERIEISCKCGNRIAFR
jgi:uncharacterized protein YbaR (Trm112 family)